MIQLLQFWKSSLRLPGRSGERSILKGNYYIIIMANTKKMTLKYWDSLSEGSKRRALTYVFPLHKATVDMLMNDEPNPKDDPWWGLVWRKVRIPEADSNGYRHYKTVVNDTYIP